MADPPSHPGGDQAVDLAAVLVDALRRQGLTLACAESLTGGLVSAAVTAVPGASVVYRGGVVAYASDLKRDLLGVDAALLGAVGAVHPHVAEQMADGVRARLGVDVAVSTTGVAGPDPQDGHPPGTVWVAVADQDGSAALDAGQVARLALERSAADGLDAAGTRAAVREAVCRRTLEVVLERVRTR